LISNRIGGDREWGVLSVPSGGVRVTSDVTEVVRVASSPESLVCLWRRGFVSAGVGEGSGSEGARGWKKCAVVTGCSIDRSRDIRMCVIPMRFQLRCCHFGGCLL
jgi:hypothetical protein